MPQCRLLLGALLILLGGCQTVDQAWNRSTAAVGGLFDTPATSDPAPTTAAPIARPDKDPLRGLQPIHSDTELASIDVPDQPFADEAKDFGTPPVSSLIPDNYRGATPTTLAGGRLIDTDDLHQRLIDDNPPLLINTIPGETTEIIPGSVWLSGAGDEGSFGDATQQRLEQKLNELTGGDKDRMMVFYCTGLDCWSAYNAALRAGIMRYTRVFWYRGGLTSWYSAGLPSETTRDDRW